MSAKPDDISEEISSRSTVEKTVEKLLKAMKEKPEITTREMMEITGLTRRGVEWNLTKLKKEGRIRRIGPDRGGVLGGGGMSDIEEIQSNQWR